VSAAVCPHLQCRVRGARTVTTKPLVGLMIVAVLAVSAAASVRVTHDPGSTAISPPSLRPEPATSGESAFLVFPSLGASGGTAAGIKLARPRILRITP
jgi:hypothetical protein